MWSGSGTRECITLSMQTAASTCNKNAWECIHDHRIMYLADRQILEFPQKRNFHFRFGGNLDFRVADFLRAESPLWRIRFCGNANFWHCSGRKFGENFCFCAVLPHLCHRSQFRKVLSHEVDNWERRAPSSLYFEVKTRMRKKMKKDVKRCKSWIAGKLRDEAKLDYSTTLVGKLNIMKMAEISMALGCHRFHRSLSGWESGWEIHRPDTTWKLAAISHKKNKLE